MTITIVGAGLAGLATAYRLNQSGLQVRVLEANNVVGGRIQPVSIEGSHQDLGPTWVWPYAQPVIQQWLDELGLALFDQYDSGAGLIDQSPSESAIQQNLPSQYGIARIKGGTHALIAALTNKLPQNVLIEHAVNHCTHVDGQWQLSVTTPEHKDKPLLIKTDRLVVATPPRLASEMIETSETALSKAVDSLQQAETWMAPHAKVVALFESPFWRDAGLSGRVASQVGPLVEIHDHCGPDGTPAALFGFAGVPAQLRHDAKEQFVEAIKQQLKRCFGETAPTPTNIIIKDWAFEPYTSTEADRNGSGAHPHVLNPSVRAAHCDRSLWFGCSETASRSPGLIEGALARADELTQDIIGAKQG